MQQLSDVCAKLRRWPRRVSTDQRSLARECLALCCEIFEADRAVLLLDNGEEPWLSISTVSGGEFTWIDDENLSLESVVAEELAERSFYIDESDRLHFAQGGQVRVKGAIDHRLRGLVGDSTVLTIGITSESLQGRLLVCDPKLDVDVALAAADPMSALLAVQFESSAQLRTAIREAVEEERTRVAHDLHDGLLQSFTGVVLQLETVHSMLDNDPQNARRMITEAQGLIMSDQRELRRFVEELRPRPPSAEAKFDFSARLDELRRRFETQWGIHVAVDLLNIDPTISGFLGQETFRLINEAVVNSVKHGRATDVHVAVHTSGSEMHIKVADNGTGFPFQGRLTLEQMRTSGTGPFVLAERVSSLNGNLILDSTEGGAIVTMTVPLGFGG